MPSYIYTANPKDPPVVETCVMKMEGLLQDLRTKRVDHIELPKAMPVQFVAGHLGCSVGSVKRWLVAHNGERENNELSDRFCDVYECIANELAAGLSAKTFAIAYNTDNSQAFAAQKWLLERMDPWTFGDAGTEGKGRSQDADIPQAVFEALTTEERAELEKIDADVDARNRRADELLEKAALRAAQEDQ